MTADKVKELKKVDIMDKDPLITNPGVGRVPEAVRESEIAQ